MLSAARRYPRLAFALFGFLIAWASFWFLTHWLDIFRGAFGMSVIYDTRPFWLRALMALVQYLPWLAIGVLVVLRFPYREAVRPLSFAGGVVGYHVFVAASLFFGPAAEDYAHTQRFESIAWSRNDRSNVMWPARLTMIDDLLARYQLQGMSKDSLTLLLGPADSTTYWQDWDLVYWLGPERGLIRIDSEWLVVRLGQDGRVREYRVVRH